ncbi:MAG: hypothetical protein LBD85_03870 [Oscillospiraceae bacterium]|nr:hypothetical protein [Oscillospiraceae bacterium]
MECGKSLNPESTQYRASLKETSKDTSDKSGKSKVGNNAQEEYMTESDIQVINFDEFFVKDFAAETNTRQLPSCDALYVGADGTYTLIEFKNGKIEVENNPLSTEKLGKKIQRRNKVDNAIKQQLSHSLLILLKAFGKDIDFLTRKLGFILVYNEDKNPNIAKSVQESKSYNEISAEVGTLGNYPILPGGFGYLRNYRPFLKSVNVYTKEQFEEKFVAGISR